jgi:hypothetical protein
MPMRLAVAWLRGVALILAGMMLACVAAPATVVLALLVLGCPQRSGSG